MKPSIASIGDRLHASQLTRPVRDLQEQLKAAEKQKETLASALDRARKTPKARKVVPAKSARATGEELVRVIIPDTHGCKADQSALAACLGDVKTLSPDEACPSRRSRRLRWPPGPAPCHGIRFRNRIQLRGGCGGHAGFPRCNAGRRHPRPGSTTLKGTTSGGSRRGV
jgi:hypothetical protein